MQLDGSFGISQSNEKEVWSVLFNILETRMKRGEFTVIDATNSKTSEMNRYMELAKAYRYRVYCVDFTDLPIEECKRRNNLRPEYKRVPEEVIDKQYSRFAGQSVPRAITVIKPDELEEILIYPLDVSEYKKIHYIGDVHGCYTALMEYIDSVGGIKDDELFVFTGDYIDRGIENAEVLNFLISICEKPNICLLEGNHDRAIYDYAHSIKTGKKQFDDVTFYELEKANIDKKQLRILYRKIRQCAYYDFHGNYIFSCHAGISKMPENLLFLATEQMIKGIGQYKEMEQVCENWDKFNPWITQVFGHRNVEDIPIPVNNSCYNLEGNVEFGGYLRTVTFEIDENYDLVAFPYSVKNNVVATEEYAITEENKKEADINLLMSAMRKDNFIKENKFDNISAFNFTRGAFRRGIWNNLTTKARGLFINTNTKEIVARSYDKFFRINEVEETQIIFLKSKFKYPLDVYVKYNGFLGIIGYDKESDELIIASKSSLDGDHVQYFKNILEEKNICLEGIKQYLKETNCSMVFEVIDTINDPHIIKYEENDVILLDVIENSMKFRKLDYEGLQRLADIFNLTVKEKATVIKSTQEFWNWYHEVTQEDYKYNDEYVEGFVIEDSNGFTVKVKLDYYNQWKFMRGVLGDVIRQGFVVKTSALTSKFHNDFYNWCKENRDRLPDNIIAARDMFESEVE